IEFITDTTGISKKKIKPNCKALGTKVGKDMKLVAGAIQNLGAAESAQLEQSGRLQLAGTAYRIGLEDVEILAEDVAGWQVANLGNLTVGLDVQITEELRNEGLARELINRLQKLRKEKGLEVTDRIQVTLGENSAIERAVEDNLSYICTEILANGLVFSENIMSADVIEIEIGRAHV